MTITDEQKKAFFERPFRTHLTAEAGLARAYPCTKQIGAEQSDSENNRTETAFPNSNFERNF